MDAVGYVGSASSVVTLDTIASSITPPFDVVAEASSASGAVVAFATPGATDAVDSAPVVVCSPASGSLFHLGSTTVNCTVTDAVANARTVSFHVTVGDTTAP